MRRISLCLLVLAGCSFDGSEGEPVVPPPPPPPMAAPLPPGVFTISGTIQSDAERTEPSEFGVVLLRGDTQLSATDAFCYPSSAPKLVLTDRTFTIKDVANGSYLVLGYRLAANKERFERTLVRVDVADRNVDQVTIALLPQLSAIVFDGPGDQEIVRFAPPPMTDITAFKGFAFRLNEEFEEACHGGTEIAVRNMPGRYEANPRDTNRVKVSIENKAAQQLAVRIQEVDAEEDDDDDDGRWPRRR